MKFWILKNILNQIQKNFQKYEYGIKKYIEYKVTKIIYYLIQFDFRLKQFKIFIIVYF